MTREEAIVYILEWLKDEYALNSKDREALDMAIKALEQESVLDKIMSEINFICEENGVSHIHIADVEKIIGRYKGEEEC